MSWPGPGDQQDNGNAGADADRETLQHRTAVPRPHRACPGHGGRQVLINTCGYLLVDSLKERGYDASLYSGPSSWCAPAAARMSSGDNGEVPMGAE
jgi:hypothetical protein